MPKALQIFQSLRTGWHTLSFKLTLATVAVVLTVAVSVHALWQTTAEKSARGIVTELNREILQGVLGTILSLADDVAASQQLTQALFEQHLLSLDSPRQVEQYLLNLVAARPLYSWAQIGFDDGDFWGANRLGEDRLRLVIRRWDKTLQKSRRTTTTYRIDRNGLAAVGVDESDENYTVLDRPWYKTAIANPGRVTWSDVYLYAASHTPGIDSALSTVAPSGQKMVLGIGLELKHLSDYLGRLPVAAKGRVFIINGKSQVLASSAPASLQAASRQSDVLRLPSLESVADPLLGVAREAVAIDGQKNASFRSLQVSGQAGERYFVTVQPVGYADWVLGTVIPERVFLENSQQSQRFLLYLLSGFALLAAALAAHMGRRWVGQPADALIAATRQIERGEFDTRLSPGGSAEFARLGTAFNYMAASLRERERERDIFGRVVSPEVREKLLAGQLQLGGETCWVSVIFSDIRGFSTLSEHMSPQEVVALLNEFMTAMSEAISPRGGYINNFIGDAIVAVFGAPIAHDDIEWRAVSAALAMRERVELLNDKRRARGETEITSGIGISTGEAVAGQIGSLDRLLYTVIGDAVNIASRLETMTKDFDGNPILMNGRTAQALQGRDGLRIVSCGPMSIRGRTSSVEVYRLDSGDAGQSRAGPAASGPGVVTAQPA